MNYNHRTKKPLVDAEVLQALQLGDHRAYDKIYLCYKEPVEQFLVKLLGSHDEASDVVQELFITLWERRENIDPHGNIKGYLFTIAKNAAFKRIAQKKLRCSQSDVADSLRHNDTTPDSTIIARDTRLLIEIAVSNMPAARRQVFSLYLDGLSYDEIAERLSIAKGNVQKHISRARIDLRELLYLVAFFLMS